jgi:bifunctional non-homologous end joining protein LigD
VKKRALEEYRAKRAFGVTAEPEGADVGAAPDGYRYVVQKHAARALHYDLRLELGGVLLSWAVPRGPSLSPRARRLAVRTEDHPIEYEDFEGVIPAGEYGGGAVIVWDRGTWAPEGDAHDMLARGRLTFAILGEKLRGRWHLIRTAKPSAREQWLFFKAKDEHARAAGPEIVDARPESVVSGRTLEELVELAGIAPPRRAARSRSRAPRARRDRA